MSECEGHCISEPMILLETCSAHLGLQTKIQRAPDTDSFDPSVMNKFSLFCRKPFLVIEEPHKTL